MTIRIEVWIGIVHIVSKSCHYLIRLMLALIFPPHILCHWFVDSRLQWHYVVAVMAVVQPIVSIDCAFAQTNSHWMLRYSYLVDIADIVGVSLYRTFSAWNWEAVENRFDVLSLHDMMWLVLASLLLMSYLWSWLQCFLLYCNPRYHHRNTHIRCVSQCQFVDQLLIVSFEHSLYTECIDPIHQNG